MILADLELLIAVDMKSRVIDQTNPRFLKLVGRGLVKVMADCDPELTSRGDALLWTIMHVCELA